MMKKIVSLLLAFIMVCSLAAGALGEESYPTEWDLSDIYADEAAWEADYQHVLTLFAEYEKFRGKLNNPQEIHDFIVFDEDGEAADTYRKLKAYPLIGLYKDGSDPVLVRLSAKADELEYQRNKARAFAEAEIYALPMEERQKIFADPIFEDMTYYVKKYTDPKRVHLSEDAAAALGTLEAAALDNEDIYYTMFYTDLPVPELTMPDGTVVELDDIKLQEIIYSPDYDREFKFQATELYNGRSAPYLNTFARLLEGMIRGRLAKARLNGYETLRESVLAKEDVEPEIYDMVMAFARKHLPELHRYNQDVLKYLGVDLLYLCDTAGLGLAYEQQAAGYDDLVALSEQALSVLGGEYIRKYSSILRSGHVDVYPTKNKQTGAISVPVSQSVRPYLFVNHYGMASTVGDLVHEMGHALYITFCDEHQPGWNSDITIFTHEVAATVNELLLHDYMIKNAKDKEEKLYRLYDVLSTFDIVFFTQIKYEEFEDYAVGLVEDGEALNGADLSRKMNELNMEYYGDAIRYTAQSGNGWTMIPHFYESYYVYSYSTAMIFATSIVRRILAGEEGAVEDYLNFLKAGRSAKPSELLAIAGVDPLKEETYESGMAYFTGLLDEFEKLLEER